MNRLDCVSLFVRFETQEDRKRTFETFLAEMQKSTKADIKPLSLSSLSELVARKSAFDAGYALSVVLASSLSIDKNTIQLMEKLLQSFLPTIIVSKLDFVFEETLFTSLRVMLAQDMDFFLPLILKIFSETNPIFPSYHLRMVLIFLEYTISLTHVSQDFQYFSDIVSLLVGGSKIDFDFESMRSLLVSYSSHDPSFSNPKSPCLLSHDELCKLVFSSSNAILELLAKDGFKAAEMHVSLLQHLYSVFLKSLVVLQHKLDLLSKERGGSSLSIENYTREFVSSIISMTMAFIRCNSLSYHITFEQLGVLTTYFMFKHYGKYFYDDIVGYFDGSHEQIVWLEKQGECPSTFAFLSLLFIFKHSLEWKLLDEMFLPLLQLLLENFHFGWLILQEPTPVAQNHSTLYYQLVLDISQFAIQNHASLPKAPTEKILDFLMAHFFNPHPLTFDFAIDVTSIIIKNSSVSSNSLVADQLFALITEMSNKFFSTETLPPIDSDPYPTYKFEVCEPQRIRLASILVRICSVLPEAVLSKFCHLFNFFKSNQLFDVDLWIISLFPFEAIPSLRANCDQLINSVSLQVQRSTKGLTSITSASLILSLKAYLKIMLVYSQKFSQIVKEAFKPINTIVQSLRSSNEPIDSRILSLLLHIHSAAKHKVNLSWKMLVTWIPSKLTTLNSQAKVACGNFLVEMASIATSEDLTQLKPTIAQIFRILMKDNDWIVVQNAIMQYTALRAHVDIIIDWHKEAEDLMTDATSVMDQLPLPKEVADFLSSCSTIVSPDILRKFIEKYKIMLMSYSERIAIDDTQRLNEISSAFESLDRLQSSLNS